VSGNGLTTEVLTWKAAPGNNPVCPDSPGSFVMSDEIVLSTSVNGSGQVIGDLIASGNLLDQGLLDINPGSGHCVK